MDPQLRPITVVDWRSEVSDYLEAVHDGREPPPTSEHVLSNGYVVRVTKRPTLFGTATVGDVYSHVDHGDGTVTDTSQTTMAVLGGDADGEGSETD